MLIYIALEHYPCLFKPYFDTQFDDFVKHGHQLKIFSCARQSKQLTDKVIEKGLNELTVNYPGTLKHVPSKLWVILKSFFRNPMARIQFIFRAIDASYDFKLNLMNVARAMILPVKSPDLFLIHNLITATQFVFLKKIYKNTPVVIYYHGGEISGVKKIEHKPGKNAFDSADIILTNTRFSKQQVINFGVVPDRIKLNPVGFDINEFPVSESRQYRKGGILKLISIGRISKEKGFIYALHAIKLLKDRGLTNVHYTVVGDGLELGALQDFVHQNQLEDFVDLPGAVSSRTQLFNQISQADALILPSIKFNTWEENQGCVLQEAMLLKTIVLTSITGGVPESIAPEMKPYSFPPEEPEAITECIVNVMSLSSDELRALGMQCLRFAQKNYDIITLNKNIIEIANDL